MMMMMITHTNNIKYSITKNCPATDQKNKKKRSYR